MEACLLINELSPVIYPWQISFIIVVILSASETTGGVTAEGFVEVETPIPGGVVGGFVFSVVGGVVIEVVGGVVVGVVVAGVGALTTGKTGGVDLINKNI